MVHLYARSCQNQLRSAALSSIHQKFATLAGIERQVDCHGCGRVPIKKLELQSHDLSVPPITYYQMGLQINKIYIRCPQRFPTRQ